MELELRHRHLEACMGVCNDGPHQRSFPLLCKSVLNLHRYGEVTRLDSGCTQMQALFNMN